MEKEKTKEELVKEKHELLARKIAKLIGECIREEQPELQDEYA